MEELNIRATTFLPLHRLGRLTRDGGKGKKTPKRVVQEFYLNIPRFWQFKAGEGDSFAFVCKEFEKCKMMNPRRRQRRRAQKICFDEILTDFLFSHILHIWAKLDDLKTLTFPSKVKQKEALK